MTTSCGSSSDGQFWTVVASFTTTESDEMQAILADLEAAANRDARLHLKIEDHAGDLEAQRALVKDKTRCGDVLILVPLRHGSFDREIHKLHKEEHPILVIGQDVGHDSFAAALMPDDLAIGRAAGRWARDRLPGGGNIVALKGNMSSKRSQDRQRGFLQGLSAPAKDAEAKVPQVVYESEAGSTKETAVRAMRDALLAHSKVDLVFAHSDTIAFGAYEAAVEAQREADFSLIGIGALEDKGLQWLDDGVLSATLHAPTGGSEAINYAMRILSGEKLVAERVRLPSRLFTADTLGIGGTPVR